MWRDEAVAIALLTKGLGYQLTYTLSIDQDDFERMFILSSENDCHDILRNIIECINLWHLENFFLLIQQFIHKLPDLMKHIAIFYLKIVLLLIKNIKITFIILYLINGCFVKYGLKCLVLRLECFQVYDFWDIGSYSTSSAHAKQCFRRESVVAFASTKNHYNLICGEILIQIFPCH